MDCLLPLGSKIELKNRKRLMIIGYLPSKPNDVIQYDYVCCRNRYGINWKKDKLELDKHYFYVKNSDITNVLYVGYSDKLFDIFSHSLDLVKDRLARAKCEKDNLNDEELNKLYVDSLRDYMEELGDGNEE